MSRETLYVRNIVEYSARAYIINAFLDIPNCLERADLDLPRYRFSLQETKVVFQDINCIIVSCPYTEMGTSREVVFLGV